MSWLRLMEESIKKEESSAEGQPADAGGAKPAAKGHRITHLVKEMWPAYLIEILVIILGISITLALEEWRDGNKEEKIEKAYQKNLLTDIGTDLQSLKTITESTQYLLVKGNELLGFIRSPGVHALTPAEIVFDVRQLLGRPDFISSDATFSDLKNSGNLRLIRDIPLKNLLFAYYNHAQVIREIQDAELQATIAISGPYFLKRFPLGEPGRPLGEAGSSPPVLTSAELQELPKNIEFGNNVLLRVNNRQELLERYQRAAELGERLKKMLSEKAGE
jgi:hypothetical protein